MERPGLEVQGKGRKEAELGLPGYNEGLVQRAHGVEGKMATSVTRDWPGVAAKQ